MWVAIKDWFQYVMEEIRNPDRNVAGFAPGEISRIPINANLKAVRTKTYANRTKKGTR